MKPRSLPRRCCTPLNRVGRHRRLHAPRRRPRHDAGRASRMPTSRSSRAAGSASRCRTNSAARACRRRVTPSSTNSSSSSNLAFSMYPGLMQGAVAALIAHGTDEQKKTYLPKMIAGELGRHHEPHRAALRHGPRPAAHQGGASRRTAATRSPAPRSSSPAASRTSPRTSSIWCWRASRARRPARKGISLFVVPKMHGQCRRLARRAQRRVLRLDRRQDGHSRQFDLRDELRRRDRLADRRGKPRPQRDVRDDERGAARRRHSGSGACRRSPIRTPRSTRGSACRAAR